MQLMSTLQYEMYIFFFNTAIDIVDKTASFVARNGPEFENRIRQNEINNSKFNFLNPADAYHAYYQHKVKEFREGKGLQNFFSVCTVFTFKKRQNK